MDYIRKAYKLRTEIKAFVGATLVYNLDMNSLFLILISFFGFSTVFAQEESFENQESLSISLHKENYLIPYYRNQKLIYDAADKEELKYQLSLKFTLFYIGTSYFAAAYSQKSFWQVYDEEGSRPFRETNYNPEIFFRSGNPLNYIDLGYEHESNGREEPESRSWDRVFLRAQYSSRSFKLGLKWWVIVEDEKYPDLHSERDDPIQDYYGNAEIDLGIMVGGTILKTLGRYNYQTYNGYVEAKLLWRLAGQMYWGAFYTKGYGDNLRSYNIDNESVGIGILSNP